MACSSGYLDEPIAHHCVLGSEAAFLQWPLTCLELRRKGQRGCSRVFRGQNTPDGPVGVGHVLSLARSVPSLEAQRAQRKASPVLVVEVLCGLRAEHGHTSAAGAGRAGAAVSARDMRFRTFGAAHEITWSCAARWGFSVPCCWRFVQQEWRRGPAFWWAIGLPCFYIWDNGPFRPSGSGRLLRRPSSLQVRMVFFQAFVADTMAEIGIVLLVVIGFHWGPAVGLFRAFDPYLLAIHTNGEDVL